MLLLTSGFLGSRKKEVLQDYLQWERRCSCCCCCALAHCLHTTMYSSWVSKLGKYQIGDRIHEGKRKDRHPNKLAPFYWRRAPCNRGKLADSFLFWGLQIVQMFQWRTRTRGMLDGTVGKCAAPFLLWLSCSWLSLSLSLEQRFGIDLHLVTHLDFIADESFLMQSIFRKSSLSAIRCWKSECLCNPWSEICKPVVGNLGIWWKKVMHLHHPVQSAVWFFSIKGKKITLPNLNLFVILLRFAHNQICP